MKSPIAKYVTETARILSATASLAEAQSSFPGLLEAKPGVWGRRLFGGAFTDALDIKLTFTETHLVEIWVRATVWNSNDFQGAWAGLWAFFYARHGEPASSNSYLKGAYVRWKANQFESVEVQRRRSTEIGTRELIQLIVIRKFDQPGAASLSTRSLWDLCEEAEAAQTQPSSIRKKAIPSKAKLDFQSGRQPNRGQQ